MDFLIAIIGGLIMTTVMCLLYNKYGAKGVSTLVIVLLIICGVLVHQAGGNVTIFMVLLVPMVLIRLGRSLLLMNLLFIGLFFGSCYSIKTIEPTEIETEAVFNYNQVFTAKLVAQGVGEVPLYKECKRVASTVKFAFTGKENYEITDDGGGGSISWSNETSIVYTVNGKVTEITYFYGEDNWVKYW